MEASPEMQWSFVGSKARQHWLWYAYNTKTGGVLAYTFGPRTDETCRELLALLTPFNIGMITSDDWGSYGREVPKDKHLTGKIFTQRIERNNLTLAQPALSAWLVKQSASRVQ
ncbi:Transposase [Shigella dysenteriae 1617]|uniref:Transposase n=1 Tax=Shigella dysenteriae 1617 TaxID=754093 RepID=A0A0A6ZUC7_SHIDY|nr:Transposase [Shigella dysenteriae 1617]